MRSTETRRAWIIGLVFGVLVALIMNWLGGAPEYVIRITAFVLLGFLVSRTLGFLAGALLGLAAGWFFLVAQFLLSGMCVQVDARAGCLGFYVEFWLGAAVMALGLGALVGVLALRRRSRQVRSQTGS